MPERERAAPVAKCAAEIAYEGVLGTWYIKCPACGFDRRGLLSDEEAERVASVHNNPSTKQPKSRG